MSTMRHLLISIFLTLQFIGCTSNAEQNNALGTFDISPDDKVFLFSYFENDVSSIYESDANGDAKVILSDTKTKASFICPKYSPDGETIAFIKFEHGKNASNVFLLNKELNSIKQLTNTNFIITEIAFSSDGKRLFYIQAQEYGSYSPIGRKAPHKVDIYSLDLTSLQTTRITNLQSYGIDKVSEIKKDHLVFRAEDNEGGGIYMLSITKPDSLKTMKPQNDPREDVGLYYDPTFNPALGKMAFTAPYEIYTMSIETSLAERIYRSNSHISNLVFFHHSPKLAFILDGENQITVIGIDGTGLGKINLIR